MYPCALVEVLFLPKGTFWTLKGIIFHLIPIYKITPLSTQRKSGQLTVERGRECFVGLSMLLLSGGRYSSLCLIFTFMAYAIRVCTVLVYCTVPCNVQKEI